MLLKRPALYERTTELFWNDPYIATQMLKAHLDPNTDATTRRPEFIDRIVAWILSLPLPENARLLDIGCGPGLYTKRLAERGLRVTGIDFNPRSIDYAKEHDPCSEYVLQNFLAMDYENAFDIITLIWCEYGALVPGEREELLRRVHRALKPGGLFVFDVNMPRYLAGFRNKKTCNICPAGGFWSPGSHICLHAEYAYGEIAGVRRYVVIDKRGLRRYNNWFCCFTQRSLLDETTPAGFSAANFYSNMMGAPYSEDSEILCAVLRKEEKEWN